MFILPLKLKYLAWVYLGVTAWNVVQMLLSYSLLRFYWLMPLVPLANYFLFFGRDFLNLFPDSWRRPHRNYRTTAGPRPNANLGQFLPLQIRRKALSAQVRGLRPDGYGLSRPRVPLLLKVQWLPLLLHRPYQ